MPHRAIVRVIQERRLGIEDFISLIVVVVVCLALVFGGFGIYKNLEAARHNRAALCTFKYDLIKRRDATQQYLREHAGKDMILGIPRSTWEQSLQNQTDTIASLRALKCPQDTPGGE